MGFKVGGVYFLKRRASRAALFAFPMAEAIFVVLLQAILKALRVVWFSEGEEGGLGE